MQMPRFFLAQKQARRPIVWELEALPTDERGSMIPVDQTILHTEETVGNCWQACIASLLELPIEDVPHFILHEDWWEATKAFVSVHKPGWTIEHYPTVFPAYQDPDHPEAPTHVIGSGQSPRGDFLHAAIVDAVTGELAHDPHPSRAGFVGEMDGMFALIAKPVTEYVEAAK
ncbi:hypothetical protein ArV1_093 [Arthrobacter phage vB_ArtM-ArV1]|uniref:Uncharacterized protein n=1 Tax=Arthrobacter phage vB_ArtM-ArV1 TaxID=1566993 RepID=A0A0A7HE98_9CAUD|nr:hypothetical protein ArV1_093 [Arthrobacter phage vB_ArtM-ArV1]AIZ01780.1 hypothetical protein ArV1_093 [Arthrobacter phage vB_ArtM-ArV1]